MPHHKSCKKRMRTSEAARATNRVYRSQYRSLVRKVRESKDQPTGKENLRVASSMLDSLTRKGILHKNTASNYKSHLSRFVNQLPA
ncbi:MAG: 30S ribosomal protein S20 [bacterium]|nr:30S ribosomal protein S20 [bacterium]